MKIKIICISIVSMFLLTGLATLSVAEKTETKEFGDALTFRGHIKEDSSNEPVEGVLVGVYVELLRLGKDTTDDSGYFEIEIPYYGSGKFWDIKVKTNVFWKYYTHATFNDITKGDDPNHYYIDLDDIAITSKAKPKSSMIAFQNPLLCKLLERLTLIQHFSKL